MPCFVLSGKSKRASPHMPQQRHTCATSTAHPHPEQQRSTSREPRCRSTYPLVSRGLHPTVCLCYKPPPRNKARVIGPPPFALCQALYVHRPLDSRIPEASEPPPNRMLRSTMRVAIHSRVEALLAGAVSLRVLGADAHAVGSGDFLHRSHVSARHNTEQTRWSSQSGTDICCTPRASHCA